MSSVKHIPFGLRDGQPITVFELKEDEFLDKCNCTCPECGYPLIACSPEGKQIRHFRHKSGDQHCHFHLDVHLMEFVFGLLSKVDHLPEITEDDFVRLSVRFNQKRVSNFPEEVPQPKRTFKIVERNGQKIKVIIDGVEYSLRFIFNKRERKDEADISLIVNLSDLIKNGMITKEDFDQILELTLDRINRVTRVKTFEPIQLEIIERPEPEKPKEPLPFPNLDLSDDKKLERKALERPDFRWIEVRNGKCPVCKEGHFILRTNRNNGERFYGCSNFSANKPCKYTMPEYYDYTLERWFFASKGDEPIL